jgi:predicted amino acid dehydrogenase
VCDVSVRSLDGRQVRGVYIDCFIPPDKLDARFLRENLGRVRDAAECAIREGARIASLGGFSSILLEGKLDLLPQHTGTAFTTGNTLTVAFIVQGVERAVELAGRDFHDASLLIVGATGDVGSGCARSLARRVKRLLLCARNSDRLERLAGELASLGSEVKASTDLHALAANADLVICAASMTAPTLLLEALPYGAIVCDAGYPKNLCPDFHPPGGAVFVGGLGQVVGGFSFDPDLLGILNPHPFLNVSHGCMLEGVALAMEGRFEAFSLGRGFIHPARVEQISSIARKHGIVPAPLFNRKGPLEAQLSALSPAQEVRR